MIQKQLDFADLQNLLFSLHSTVLDSLYEIPIKKLIADVLDYIKVQN